MTMAAPALDWGDLRMRRSVRSIEAAELDVPRGARVYLSTPISAYLARGEADLCLHLAAEWQAWLLSEGIPAICPALLTVPPVFARGDDPVGRMLQAMEHDWWMFHCHAWMDCCHWCVVPPIEGWQESLGVYIEARRFAVAGQPVRLLRGRA